MSEDTDFGLTEAALRALARDPSRAEGLAQRVYGSAVRPQVALRLAVAGTADGAAIRDGLAAEVLARVDWGQVLRALPGGEVAH